MRELPGLHHLQLKGLEFAALLNPDQQQVAFYLLFSAVELYYPFGDFASLRGQVV
jgi:hypothetical protein